MCHLNPKFLSRGHTNLISTTGVRDHFPKGITRNVYRQCDEYNDVRKQQ